jgi:hypothetical protein
MQEKYIDRPLQRGDGREAGSRWQPEEAGPVDDDGSGGGQAGRVVERAAAAGHGSRDGDEGTGGSSSADENDCSGGQGHGSGREGDGSGGAAVSVPASTAGACRPPGPSGNPTGTSQPP